MKQPDPWDVIVVGSGATGGWAAYRLAQRGLSVLVLEAGPDGLDAPAEHPARALADKRLVDRITRRRRVQMRHPAYWELDPDHFVVDSELPYDVTPDAPFDWIRTRAVNGRLLTWGGIGVRVSDHELAAPEQDGFGAPWPIRYADLAPHFDRIDAFLPVYGRRDGLPHLPDGQYVATPRLTEAEQRFCDIAARTMPERKVVPSRGVLVRVSSRPRGELPPPSPVREAVRLGANLRADAVVSHVTVDDAGKPTGIAFIDRLTKRHHEVRARAIALCASTLESTRILLNSTSSHHPSGLGNSSQVLGHYLTDHPALYLSGFVPGRRDAPWEDGEGGPKNILIPRFHNLENRPGGAFLRGYGVFGGMGRAGMDSVADCGPAEVPFTLVAYGEMLPRYENCVRIVPGSVDAWGIPVLDIHCRLSANEHAMREHMVSSLTEMIHAAGGRVSRPPTLLNPGGFVHEMGTARMGSDPRSSVVDSFGRLWDAPNLYVMDGAVWATNAWQNPTFTMMAIAGRASDHLADTLARGNP